MTSLNANQMSFITMMGKSEEHARRGFELILKRKDFLKFFDALIEAGFFDAATNPAPVPVQPEGSVRIPYWTALDYLVACAKVAGENDDAELAEKVMAIVRAVTMARDPEGLRDNFYTFRKFAEIIGLLPTKSISSADLEFVQSWLDTKFDRDMVAHALDERALPRFLESNDPADWQKAVQSVRYCTAIRWEPARLSPDAEEPVTIVEEYWLKDLINHHASALGKKAGSEAARLFEERVGEVFGRGGRAEWSYVFRPAVDEDGQNRRSRGAENCVVGGLRDVLLSWCDVDAPSAKTFVDGLLLSDNEMLRRIGIYLLSERWESLNDPYLPLVRPELFDAGHLHELYALLRDHFETFSDKEKGATIKAIQSLSIPDGDDAVGCLERFQRRWLNAISGTGYEPAARWLGELVAKHGAQPEHPDYLSFIESRWGHGPSHYSVQKLVAFAEERSIVEKLSTFTPSDTWQRPTLEAVVDELERAVQVAPTAFVRVLQDFLKATRPYQYGLIKGFLKLWREPNEKTATVGWDVAWVRLFEFFGQLLQNPEFWKDGESKAREVTPMWIASAIADLLQSGTRDDERAYPASLLPRGWSLLEILVERGEAVSEPGNDPMSQAVNSPKGRAIEAVFSHVLRSCRVADKETGSHAAAWAQARWLMDRELKKCVDGNFEFSTLAGAYLGNLEYIDVDWLQKNIEEIFPVARPANFACAIGGLAYASASRRTYRMLRDSGVMDSALRLEVKGRHGREKLMERLALGYLWGEEALDSHRFSYLFESGRADDLELVNFFLWSIRGETLKEDQVSRIISYWRRCIAWAQTLPSLPVKLLSSLSGLTAFLTTAAGEHLELLLAVAPHVHVHHSAYEFLEELNRLVEISSAEVRTVLGKFIETHEPFYDYEDRMQTLVSRLAELGFREDALNFCNHLRSMPGMADLFFELTSHASLDGPHLR